MSDSDQHSAWGGRCPSWRGKPFLLPHGRKVDQVWNKWSSGGDGKGVQVKGKEAGDAVRVRVESEGVSTCWLFLHRSPVTYMYCSLFLHRDEKDDGKTRPGAEIHLTLTQGARKGCEDDVEPQHVARTDKTVRGHLRCTSSVHVGTAIGAGWEKKSAIAGAASRAERRATIWNGSLAAWFSGSKALPRRSELSSNHPPVRQVDAVACWSVQ